MKAIWTTAAALLLAAQATAGAQSITYPRWSTTAVRIGQDYTLAPGDTARQVTVLFGDATIGGRVDGDVVVILGTARLSGSADVDGSLVVVGGSATVAEGAQIHRDLVVWGGTVDAPPGFGPGGQHVVVGTAWFGGRLHAVVPWLTRGLLWGRPIVPDLPWVWTIVAIFFFVYLTLNLVFDRPVRASAVVLADKPLTAFLVGLLVLLLAGPVCLLLAVSVIGTAVVPFVIGSMFVAAVVGKIAVSRWIGASVVHETSDSRAQSLRSFVIGSVVIVLAYMVPVLGFVTWTMGGMLGLGAAALAFIRAYRRENPAPPRPPNPSPAAPSPVVPAERPAVQPEPELPVSITPPPVVAISDMASLPHAPFLDRLAAFVLDVILIAITAQILDWSDRGSDRLFFLVLLTYHIGFWAWKGTTVGGIICQLRVIRTDGGRLQGVDALVRGLSGIFSLAVLGLGGLWILRDPERQAWHDKIAGTYVVKVPRNWPI